MSTSYMDVCVTFNPDDTTTTTTNFTKSDGTTSFSTDTKPTVHNTPPAVQALTIVDNNSPVKISSLLAGVIIKTNTITWQHIRKIWSDHKKAKGFPHGNFMEILKRKDNGKTMFFIENDENLVYKVEMFLRANDGNINEPYMWQVVARMDGPGDYTFNL
jgi:hypothetical protein